jgi:uncharacterized protein (DUF697 family)
MGVDDYLLTKVRNYRHLADLAEAKGDLKEAARLRQEADNTYYEWQSRQPGGSTKEMEMNGRYETALEAELAQEYGGAGEYEAYEGGPYEYESYEYEAYEAESPLSEIQELELANELLEVTSEEELDRFLGDVFKTVGKAVGGVVRSPVGKALGGVLKGVAKKALPVVGSALGSAILPGVGTALGGQLGSMASKLFELELEGMDREQQELEVARRFVRLSATAARSAATAPRGMPTGRVVSTAMRTAAQRHAPGLLRPSGASRHQRRGRRPQVRGMAPGGGAYAYAGAEPDDPYAPPQGYDEDDGSGEGAPAGKTGRWVRRGRRIVLLGV